MKQILYFCFSIFLILSLCACENVQYHSESSKNSYSSYDSIQVKQQQNNIQYYEQPEKQNENKILIAYFSLADIVPEGADASTYATPSIGNTETAALEIQNQTGGDLFAIKTVQIYPVSHSDCSIIAEEEIKTDTRPILSTHVKNMENYNIIYIGYPIWWYIEPMAIRTFLEEYDFSDKTIIPFCTTLGADIKESENNIKSICTNSTLLNGLTLHTENDNFSSLIAQWLSEIETIK